MVIFAIYKFTHTPVLTIYLISIIYLQTCCHNILVAETN